MKTHWTWPLVVSIIVICSVAGCDSSSNDNSGLIGRWSLIEVNGQNPSPGTVLIWEFTETTLRITSDLDCVIEFTYRVSGDRIDGTITKVTGSECGDEAGDLGSVQFELNGDRLTITVVADGEEGIFVFRRI